jgi:hypothetical protein
MQDTAAVLAPLIPQWVVVLLILWAGVSGTTITAMLIRMFNIRSVDDKIATAVRQREQATNDFDERIGKLETSMFGLDGDNGVRGDSKIMRREIGAMMIVLRRLAEAASLDTKEIDVLDPS